MKTIRFKLITTIEKEYIINGTNNDEVEEKAIKNFANQINHIGVIVNSYGTNFREENKKC